MPTVLIIAPLLKDFQQNGTKIPTVAVREVVTDFKKSIRIRSYSYDTVLVSASGGAAAGQKSNKSVLF